MLNIESDTTIADLLEMVARRAPILMRAGGGPLIKERLCKYDRDHKAPKVTEEQRKEWRKLVREGRHPKDIAEECGVAYNTVRRHTHDLMMERKAAIFSHAHKSSAAGKT
jgi:DNA-binding NarL/FixJ family response regulator